VFGSQRVIVVNVVEMVAHWLILLILGFWGAKFPKMGDSLPWTPSFILAGEIRNHTNTKKHANKQ